MLSSLDNIIGHELLSCFISFTLKVRFAKAALDLDVLNVNRYNTE